MKTSHISRLKTLENKVKSRRSDNFLVVEEYQDQPGVFRGKGAKNKDKTYAQEDLDSFDGTVIRIVRTQAPLPEEKDQA